MNIHLSQKVDNMIFKSKKIKDLIFLNNKSFKDKRGYFKELLKEKDLKKKFPFLVMSFSKEGMLNSLFQKMNLIMLFQGLVQCFLQTQLLD